MKYTYPKISNTLTYKKIDYNTVEITDHLTDNSFNFDVESVRYIRQLDGYTHPYKIPTLFSRKEIHETLQFLNEYHLLRYSDIVNVSFGMKLKTLWIPKRTALLKQLACFWNTLLIIFWLPVLIIGILMVSSQINTIKSDGLLVGFGIGLVFGTFLHELSHAFAGISYGARVFEMGVMVTYLILPGAYVMLDKTPVKKHLHRIQISAAGIEANFLVCGISLILSSLLPSVGGLFLGAAVCNSFTGMYNLAFYKGFDGTHIISELLGAQDIIACAEKLFFYKEERKRILRLGSIGYALLAVCFILLLLQIALPATLALSILEVAICFI